MSSSCMNINITRSEKGSNAGSVRTLVFYLEKENKDKGTHEKEWFFSRDKDKVQVEEVIEAIDQNKLGLKKRDGKFYMMNISPSWKELQHIGNDPQKLRAFTHRVMDAYAENFNRGIKGRDLVYFAKIEYNRKYKGYDQAVKDGLVKQGELKPGNQTHIHVIVARKDRSGKRQFSPLSNHRSTQNGPVRGGFDRKAFYTAAEQAFDQETGYKRSPKETFRYRNAMRYGTAREKAEMQASLKAEQAQSLQKTQLSASLRSVGAVLKSGQDITVEQGEKQEIDPNR